MIYRLFCLLLSAVLLNGCAQHKSAPPVATTPPAEPIPSQPILHKSFERETLFDLMLGEFASKQGRMDILLEEYAKQARHTQDPAVIERALQVALYLKKPQLGTEMAQLWLKADPNSQQALNYAFLYLAQLAIAAHDAEAALAQYQKVSLGPFFGLAQIQIAQILADQNQLEQARAGLAQARKQDPEDAVDFIITEAALLVKVENYAAAEVVFKQALKEYPDNPELLYSHSVLAGQQKNWPAAERDLRRIIKMHPNSSVALNALGYTLADQNRNLKEAYELIQQAYRLEPNDPSIMDSMGWIEYRLGHYAEAQTLLEKAYKLFPDHEVAAHLGEVLWMQGKKEQAEKLWREALKKTPDSDVLRDTMKRFHVEP